MVQWEHIDTILLDMDGTLLDLHFDNFFWQEYLPLKWGERNGMDHAAARSRLMPMLGSRKGTLSWYCLDYWSEALDMDMFALNRDIEHLIGLRPQALDLLRFLAGTAKSVVLVTNAHEELLDLKLRRTGIGGFFDAIFSAHVFGLPKEEPAFWGRLAEQHPFLPARTLLIDDNLDVLRSARAYGIGGLLTVSQPDTHAPEREAAEFDAIVSFSALLPTRSA